MKRAGHSLSLASMVVQCLLATLLAGCAGVTPAVSADEMPPAQAVLYYPGILPPSALQIVDQPWSAGRRPFEIPPGFVRGVADGDTRPRRQAAEFAYVPRSISCAEAWKVAVKVGEEAGLDPALLFGVMRVESTFKVNVISYAGAIGLMQIMPGPASRLGCGDLLDPVDNARCGALILSRFLRRFDNRLILGLSAYNAGFGMPGRAKKSSTVPANFSYPENVLRVRAKFLRWGCAPWD